MIGVTARPRLYDYFDPQSGGIIDPTGFTNVSPTLIAERTAIFIVRGQSLAGCHVQGLYQPTSPKVQCVCVGGDGKLYQYKDPMLCAGTFTINGYVGFNSGYGAMWGKVGQLLIDGGKLDRVIFCNVSYAGQTASVFAPTGILGHRLPLAFNTLNALGYSPSMVTAILSHLGESDGINGTTSAAFQAYERQSIAVSRNYGFTGPWFMANSTWAYDNASATIQGAIAALVADGTLNVKAGANSDNFVGATYRYAESSGPGSKEVHPNATGRDAIAGDWYTKLVAGLGL